MLGISVAVYLFLLTFAGRQKAITDLIYQNRLAYKGYYWTKQAMEAAKDRNNDGKVSFWESNFPKDAWHRAERFKVLTTTSILPVISLWVGYQLCQYFNQFLVAAFMVVILGWFVFNASFLHYYDNVRKGNRII